MTYPGTAKTTGIGLRHVRVAVRDADGTPQVPTGTAAGTAYPGLRISGAQALTVTIPEPQRVTARGDDRTYHTFQLAPTDSPSGELRVSKLDTAVIALLSSTKEWGQSPVRKSGVATDKQGLESAVFMWGSRQAIDSDEDSAYFGRQVWQTYLFLNALVAIRPAAMEDQAVGEVTYSIAANDSTVDEFGTQFSEATNGFTRCPFLIFMTDGQYMIDTFVGDNSETEFTLSQTPMTDAIVTVAVDGVVKTVTSDYTITDGVVTLLVTPATGAKIVVEYEY